MSENAASEGPPAAVVTRVMDSFLIYGPEDVSGPLQQAVVGELPWGPLVQVAGEGLRSVVSAATLPFQLVSDAAHKRRFDHFHMAERIRALKEGPELTTDREEKAYRAAQDSMCEFLAETEGTNFMRDTIVYGLNHALDSPAVSWGAEELLIQALVSTWSVFETFAASFIIGWINAHPREAKRVLAEPSLRTYFGKQVVDIDAIDDHGFDLTRSMGSIIFRDKRLDNLSVVRSTFNALFDDQDVRDALGADLWMLNQRRHLFVHKRGLVDREYLARTGDKVEFGQRLTVTSEDIERYLVAVQKAVINISNAAAKRSSA